MKEQKMTIDIRLHWLLAVSVIKGDAGNRDD